MKPTLTIALTIVLTVLTSLSTGCATAPRTDEQRAHLIDMANETVAAFQEHDPTITEFFDSAHAYAVFPSVGKGAVGVGGAYGRGVAFQDGEPVGYCDLSQGTVGLQLGGQSYSQVIFFERRDAFERFRTGSFAFAAQASAVAARHGAAAAADYERGVAVFTMTRGGLMYEASIGGQRFTFEPLEHVE